MASDESHESTIAQGAGFILIATVLSTGLGFVIRTFLIRQLPTAKYGLFALALTVGGLLATICTLGLRQGVARMVPRCETEDEIRDVVLTGLISSLVVSLIVSGALVTFPSFISEHIFREPDLGPYLQIIGVLIPGTSIQTIALATFRGKKRVQERIIVSNFISPISRFVLITSVVFLGYSAYGAIVAWTSGVLFSSIIGMYYLYRRTNVFSQVQFKPQYRRLLYFSLPLMFSSVMWTAVQQVDNLLLGYYKTSFEVGVYDGAFLLSRSLIIVLASFGFLFMPIFSELDASDETNRMQSVYRSVTELAVLLVLPVYLGFIHIPNEILTHIFTDDYSLGAAPLIIISTGFFIHVLSGLSGDALIALGDTRFVMAGNIGIGVSNTILNIGLIPVWGVTGAAISSASSYVLFNLIYLYKLNIKLNILPVSKKFLKVATFVTLIQSTIWVVLKEKLILDIPTIGLLLIIMYFIHGSVMIKFIGFTEEYEQIWKKIQEKLGKK